MKMMKCGLCCSGEGGPTSSTAQVSHCLRGSASLRQEAWGLPSHCASCWERRLSILDETTLLKHRLVFPGKVKIKSLMRSSLDLKQHPCLPSTSYVLPSQPGQFKEGRK